MEQEEIVIFCGSERDGSFFSVKHLKHRYKEFLGEIIMGYKPSVN